MRKAMTLSRRTLLTVGAAALFIPADAWAQPYPSRIIRIVVPFAPGGGSDIVARLVGDRLSKRLQQTVIIENKPGAGAIIGADSVAKSAPDGYTLLFATPGPQILNPYLIKSLPYDPKDFAGVATLLKSVNLMVVSPNVPAKTVRELIDYAKTNPGKLNFASSGIGTSSHLAHARSGALRALGVAAPERSVVLPEVPTIAETLPGYDASSINYISAPAGTPAPIVERLNHEINAVMAEAEVRDRLVDLELVPITESIADLEKRISAESEKWKTVIEQMSVK